MLEKENTVTYATTGYHYVPSPEELIKKIDIVVKALGTMVLKPQFAPSTEIGAPKMQMPPIQEGILLGEDRKIAEEKLIELIKQL